MGLSAPCTPPPIEFAVFSRSLAISARCEDSTLGRAPCRVGRRVEFVEGLQQPVYTESTRMLKLPMRAGSWRSCARDAIIIRNNSSDAVDVPEPLQQAEQPSSSALPAACQPKPCSAQDPHCHAAS